MTNIVLYCKRGGKKNIPTILVFPTFNGKQNVVVLLPCIDNNISKLVPLFWADLCKLDSYYKLDIAEATGC